MCKEKSRKHLEKIGDSNRKAEDASDSRIRRVTDSGALQSQMDSIAQRFAEQEEGSVLDTYGFVTARPRPITYLTSIPLHTG